MGVERGRRQREKRFVKTSENMETGSQSNGWSGWSQRGRQAAGRQSTLAIHSHCRHHTVLSPPQWVTAAKQAKCRQTSTASGSPTSGLPGVGQFEQGGGTGLAGWEHGVGHVASCPL